MKKEWNIKKGKEATTKWYGNRKISSSKMKVIENNGMKALEAYCIFYSMNKKKSYLFIGLFICIY